MLAFNSLWELDGVRTKSYFGARHRPAVLSIPCGTKMVFGPDPCPLEEISGLSFQSVGIEMVFGR